MSQKAYRITVLVVVAVAIAAAAIWKVNTRVSKAAADGSVEALPTLLDFGKGECVTCKKMEPILRELADAYEGRARIEIIDIGERPDMARQYRIDLIPTQVFSDADGKEVFRNVGEMSRDDIIARLREMGVD